VRLIPNRLARPAATLIAAISLVSLCSSTAHALTIESPLLITSEGVLGTVRPGVPFGSNVVDDYANILLDMTTNTSKTVDGQFYYRNTATDPGSGEVSSTDFITGTGTFVDGGWEYLAAKYDGPNGGLVLIYLGGESAIIPETSYSLWTNKKGQGYTLSGWIAFNSIQLDQPVPDGGSSFPFLGSALLLLGILRRHV
jgi:hypothetical protein